MSDLFPIPGKALDELGPDFEFKVVSEPVRPRVKQARDGSLIWTGEPQEGAEGILADAEALVDAGIARWIAA